MARGSLAGIVSGIFVSGLALGVVSLGVPPVEIGTQGSPQAGAEPGGEPGAQAPAVVADDPVVLAPEGDASAADTAPDTAPETGGETGGDAGADSGAVATSEAAPDAATDMAADAATDAATDTATDMAEAPEAGETSNGAQTSDGAAPEVETAEAAATQPAAEPVTGDETGADPASAAAEAEDDTPMRGEAAEADLTAQANGTPLPETDRAPQMEVETGKEPMAAPDEPAAIPGAEVVEKLPPAVPPAPAEDPAPEAVADPDVQTGPESLPDTAEDKATGNALVTAPDADPDSDPAPEIATVVAEPAPAPAETRLAPVETPEPAPAPAAQPAPEAGLSGADGVVTGRLPTIGGDTAEPAPEAGTEAEAEAPGDPAGLPAIVRNGIEFVVEGDQPLLALILLDSGDRGALEDIGKLPFPLTVAVDASAPDAAEAVAFYDSRGIEVALMLPLPAGATPADVDTTVQAYRPLLDEAAEVVIDPGLEFQALGAGAVQLATNLSETGHGLVTFPSGLNTGHKSALKQGVPAGLVFLDLDGDGQEGPVIRRFLDNAAFRARNENGVIVLARTRAETLQALLEWSLGNRAQTVTLAPISAVLRAE